MRIAVLSDPSNFHTRKWARALRKVGAEVVIMSYDPVPAGEEEQNAIQLAPPVGRRGKYTYLDYRMGGPVLRQALETLRIDVVNPLNITPFGVWAMHAGFHPVAACAFGADILEYPPDSINSAAAMGRSWGALDTRTTVLRRWQGRWKQRYHQRKVAQALAHADLVTGDNQYLVDCMAQWFAVPQDKMEVLPWGVEPELFEVSSDRMQALRNRWGIAPDKKLVLSPRGAKPIYQADIILDAFSRLLAQGREDTVFLLLGAGYPVSPQVRDRAEILAKTYSNFHLVQQVLPREEIHALWNLVDVVVSAPVYDGYSAALAEGRYIGAIPVVNAIPANLELIRHGENGWICDPFDAPALARDLAHVLDHCEAYRERFAPRNREWVLQHSLMDANARRFLAILADRFF